MFHTCSLLNMSVIYVLVSRIRMHCGQNTRLLIVNSNNNNNDAIILLLLYLCTRFNPRFNNHLFVMRPLVFRPIRTVAERFQASQKLTRIRFLTGVRPLMDFQIFQSWERFKAAGKLLATNTWKAINHWDFHSFPYKLYRYAGTPVNYWRVTR